MSTFENVSFSGDLTQLVADQLATGRYRGHDDNAPGDWLDRAWHALPGAERSKLTVAIHEVLTHSNPDVRAEAVRLLDGNSRMANPECLLDIIEHHWDLFKGLRGKGESVTIDRGRDLLHVASVRATGVRGTKFRQKMAMDPMYGINVLSALAESDSSWAVDHINELVAPSIDPNGSRLTILVYNLQRRPEELLRAVTTLAACQPTLKQKLAQTISQEVDSETLSMELLDKLS